MTVAEGMSIPGLDLDHGLAVGIVGALTAGALIGGVYLLRALVPALVRAVESHTELVDTLNAEVPRVREAGAKIADLASASHSKLEEIDGKLDRVLEESKG